MLYTTLITNPGSEAEWEQRWQNMVREVGDSLKHINDGLILVESCSDSRFPLGLHRERPSGLSNRATNPQFHVELAARREDQGLSWPHLCRKENVSRTLWNAQVTQSDPWAISTRRCILGWPTDHLILTHAQVSSSSSFYHSVPLWK